MPLRVVKSTIAGIVAHIAVSEGQRVARDQAVIMLEVMKMEIAAESPVDGLVSRLFVKPGETVAEGQPLFSLET